MSQTLSIPRSTHESLTHPAPPGQRHSEIVRVACSLIAAGFNGDAIFYQLRPNYGPDVPDSEIRGVIAWAEKRIPRTDAFSSAGFPKHSIGDLNAKKNGETPPETLPADPETAVSRYLNGFSCEEVDLWEASPVRLTEPFETDPETLLNAVYGPDDNINIVNRFGINAGKAHPDGAGTTAKRAKWLAIFRENGPPTAESGVWIRINPTDGRGIADANVANYRFALVEFDTIPISLQLPLLARIPVPIAAIITSGGKSLHAWISIQAQNAEEYRGIVSDLFKALGVFGIDSANRNPSRLSRLPGTTRRIGSAADSRQRLLYLNPNPLTAKIIP